KKTLQLSNFQYEENFIIDKKPWYKLYNINCIILQLESDKTMSQETIQGFKNLQECIKNFLSNSEESLLNLNIQIDVFKNAKLK
ncbi:21697_t:CDS:1, partial [Dentiscutata erythropus]